MLFDKNMQNVQEYIKEHNIDWINSFLIQDFKSKNSIQYQFNIKFYPTFILVNSKGKILSRGSIDTFDTMVRFQKIHSCNFHKYYIFDLLFLCIEFYLEKQLI